VWRYFTSFVDPADGRWCVAVIRAPNPARFDARSAEKILTAPSLGLEGIKDPWILEHKRRFYMFLSVALPTPKTSEQSHSTLDIYNTGECLSATGLAISDNLEKWRWEGVVFRPENSGWDRYCRRINSVVPIGDGFVAFYDGSASHAENYEERTGVAESQDLKRWATRTPKGPCYVSPHGSGSLRYMDAQRMGDRMALFYEYARPDEAHDLRLLAVEKSEFDSAMARLI
jgi:hypothetical protein